MREQYDVIVIGSGISGLTLAAILSKMNKKKVLVLERHWVIGGQTHTFKRKGNFRWDIGLHYVGEMERYDLFRQVFDYITDDNLKWNRMPEHYDVFVYPDFKFKVPAGTKKYVAELIKLFPDEEKGIRKYFNTVPKGYDWLIRGLKISCLPPVINLPLKVMNRLQRKQMLGTTKEFLDTHIKDQRLKALLGSQYGNMGIPPAHSALTYHSGVVSHYLRGGYFPEGGSVNIARTIIPVIEKNGGQCLVNHEVKEVIIENGTAKGVRVNFKKGNKVTEKEYYAPVVISNIGAYETYNYLIPPFINLPFRKELKELKCGVSFINLFIGFKESPASLGFKGENHWISTSYDLDKAFDEGRKGFTGQLDYMFLSFSSLKHKNQTGKHTAEVLGMIDYDAFAKWKEQEWGNRDEDYYKLKEKITESILQLVEKHYPGFCSLIEYKELSTPLTMKKFTGRYKGTAYGIPWTPERYSMKSLSSRTPIKNFYLSGSDIFANGIIGSTFSGLMTASIVNGPIGLLRILISVKLDYLKRSIKNFSKGKTAEIETN